MNEIVTQAWSRYAPTSAEVIDAPEPVEAAALLIPAPRSQPDAERRRRGLRLHRANS